MCTKFDRPNYKYCFKVTCQMCYFNLFCVCVFCFVFTLLQYFFNNILVLLIILVFLSSSRPNCFYSCVFLR